jgi:translation initiation factor 2 gamma subunit (eIF-2gamma)
VGTTIDPSIAKGDGLVGQVLGLVGQMPSVYAEIEVRYERSFLLSFSGFYIYRNISI